MRKYAQNTTVSADKSRIEIENTVKKYGASAFAYATEGSKAIITFKMCDRLIKFILMLPNLEDYRRTPAGKRKRLDADTYTEWEKACCRSFRSLALSIKAKLITVEDGIGVFEEEFLAHIVLPDGRTVGKTILPEIADAYEKGKMPQLLLTVE